MPPFFNFGGTEMGNEERISDFRQTLERFQVAAQHSTDGEAAQTMGELRAELEGAHWEALEGGPNSVAKASEAEAAFWAFADDFQAYDIAVADGGEGANRRSVFRKRLLGRFANALGLPGIPDASKPAEAESAAGDSESKSEAPTAADALSSRGVFKGAQGLEGLLKADEFWQEQECGTRLYYGSGVGQYLHRDVLLAAVEALEAKAADERAIAQKVYEALHGLKPPDSGGWSHAPGEFLPGDVCCDFEGKQGLIRLIARAVAQARAADPTPDETEDVPEALKEPLAWLRGERSSWNERCNIGEDHNHALAESAREDAAETERAYWIVRAHKEGLVEPVGKEGDQ